MLISSRDIFAKCLQPSLFVAIIKKIISIIIIGRNLVYYFITLATNSS